MNIPKNCNDDVERLETYTLLHPKRTEEGLSETDKVILTKSFPQILGPKKTSFAHNVSFENKDTALSSRDTALQPISKKRAPRDTRTETPAQQVKRQASSPLVHRRSVLGTKDIGGLRDQATYRRSNRSSKIGSRLGTARTPLRDSRGKIGTVRIRTSY